MCSRACLGKLKRAGDKICLFSAFCPYHVAVLKRVAIPAARGAAAAGAGGAGAGAGAG
eukprot:COSAG06_NODE_13896_length_1208_cov_1.188458_2_plen_57_part_01